MLNLIEKSEAYVQETLASGLKPGIVFHDFRHANQVRKAVLTLSFDARLSKKDSHLLEISALFHDIGYIDGQKDHEFRGAGMAADFLEAQGMNEDDVDRVVLLIRSTQMDSELLDPLAIYLRDADLSYLGREDFWERVALFRKEIESSTTEAFSDREWWDFNLKFFNRHQYLSPEGRQRFDVLKKKHLKMIEELRDKG